MDTHYFGNHDANTILIQMVDDHDLALIEQEVTHISALTSDADFMLAAFKVDDWNKDLSPWPAPAVFGKEDFGGCAEQTLSALKDWIDSFRKEHSDKHLKFYIGGYSLAGLFALWAAYQTDRFAGVAAASPSVWFPDFREYAKSRELHTQTVYLSLGDREEKIKKNVPWHILAPSAVACDIFLHRASAHPAERFCVIGNDDSNHTKNPVMAQVGDAIRDIHVYLQEKNISCTLEWNAGNHFKEPDLRTAKGFAWLLNQQ